MMLSEAKKELGKAFLNLANMLLVVYLLGNYISSEHINFFVIFFILYIVVAFYFAGFYLIKEGSDE